MEEASDWIGLPLARFRETMAALGPDGASHEGVGYWEYGVEYMLKFADLSRSLWGIELTGNDWWRNTSRYALYLAVPRGAWRRDNCIVDLADCPRGTGTVPTIFSASWPTSITTGMPSGWLTRSIAPAWPPRKPPG